MTAGVKRKATAPIGPPAIKDADELVVDGYYVLLRVFDKQQSKMMVRIVEIKDVTEEELSAHRAHMAKKCWITREKSNKSGKQAYDSSQNGDDNSNKLIIPEKEKVAISCVSTKSATRNGQHKLYYVTYFGHDRRLDGWVERDVFVEHAMDPALVSPASVPQGISNLLADPGLSAATMTRSQKKIHREFHHLQTSYDDMDATTAFLEKKHVEATKLKNVDTIRINGNIVDTWYFSPYPTKHDNEYTLYLCDFCLMYTNNKEAMDVYHPLHCTQAAKRHPPGQEIYRDVERGLSLYEVIASENKTYCQSLCLLSKLFLDHKTLYFDVNTFVFYILCEVTRGPQGAARFVGHFSKELISENNLACIMVLPPYQRKGYGKLLIQFSYELSKREGWIGTPEKPLSDLGKVTFRSYWWWKLLQTLETSLDVDCEEISVKELAAAAGIAIEDVLDTLQNMNLIKGYKGEGEGYSRMEFEEAVIRFTRQVLDTLQERRIGKPSIMVEADKLRWQPSPDSARNTFQR